MGDKGKRQRPVWQLPKARGSFANDGLQEEEEHIARDGSLHCVSKESPKLPVKRPYVKSDPLCDGNLEDEDEKILSRYSNNVETDGAIRNEVKKILRLYRETLEKHSWENNKLIHKNPNIHQNAAYDVQSSRMDFLNRDKRIGAVPGVKIGDAFECRAELYIVGLHLQFGKGIAYMEKDGLKLATSVAWSNQYENTVNPHGELIYTGEGGNPMVPGYRQAKDQMLIRGNLALKNSMVQKTPIRVIRKYTFQKTDSYVYDGLHMVEKCWHERGPYNKIVYKFQFRRVSGQPRHPKGFPYKSSEHLLQKQKQGVVMEDLSRGKEEVAIAVVNTIDDERPSRFTYTAKVSIGIDNLRIGCDCDDCSDSEKECSCKVKNGRKIRYDYDECIQTKRPFIYECGPTCKCFDSCINRVSQRGIRLKLEVFKTESKGWGVRSRTRIQTGKFVCEYVGEIVKFKEIYKKGIGDNEYLFIIENNENNTQFGGLSFFEENEVLAINAAQQGNVGRFINHSCSPNLHVQYVYIGPQSKAPHIMLFALRDIKPFEELTFDYRFRLGCKKNWNRKVKICECGSSNCAGKFF